MSKSGPVDGSNKVDLSDKMAEIEAEQQLKYVVTIKQLCRIISKNYGSSSTAVLCEFDSEKNELKISCSASGLFFPWFDVFKLHPDQASRSFICLFDFETRRTSYTLCTENLARIVECMTTYAGQPAPGTFEAQIAALQANAAFGKFDVIELIISLAPEMRDGIFHECRDKAVSYFSYDKDSTQELLYRVISILHMLETCPHLVDAAFIKLFALLIQHATYALAEYTEKPLDAMARDKEEAGTARDIVGIVSGLSKAIRTMSKVLPDSVQLAYKLKYEFLFALQSLKIKKCNEAKLLEKDFWQIENMHAKLADPNVDSRIGVNAIHLLIVRYYLQQGNYEKGYAYLPSCFEAYLTTEYAEYYPYCVADVNRMAIVLNQLINFLCDPEQQASPLANEIREALPGLYYSYIGIIAKVWAAEGAHFERLFPAFKAAIPFILLYIRDIPEHAEYSPDAVLNFVTGVMDTLPGPEAFVTDLWVPAGGGSYFIQLNMFYALFRAGSEVVFDRVLEELCQLGSKKIGAMINFAPQCVKNRDGVPVTFKPEDDTPYYIHFLRFLAGEDPRFGRRIVFLMDQLKKMPGLEAQLYYLLVHFRGYITREKQFELLQWSLENGHDCIFNLLIKDKHVIDQVVGDDVESKIVITPIVDLFEVAVKKGDFDRASLIVDHCHMVYTVHQDDPAALESLTLGAFAEKKILKRWEITDTFITTITTLLDEGVCDSKQSSKVRAHLLAKVFNCCNSVNYLDDSVREVFIAFLHRVLGSVSDLKGLIIPTDLSLGEAVGFKTFNLFYAALTSSPDLIETFLEMIVSGGDALIAQFGVMTSKPPHRYNGDYIETISITEFLKGLKEKAGLPYCSKVAGILFSKLKALPKCGHFLREVITALGGDLDADVIEELLEWAIAEDQKSFVNCILKSCCLSRDLLVTSIKAAVISGSAYAKPLFEKMRLDAHASPAPDYGADDMRQLPQSLVDFARDYVGDWPLDHMIDPNAKRELSVKQIQQLAVFRTLKTSFAVKVDLKNRLITLTSNKKQHKCSLPSESAKYKKLKFPKSLERDVPHITAHLSVLFGDGVVFDERKSWRIPLFQFLEYATKEGVDTDIFGDLCFWEHSLEKRQFDRLEAVDAWRLEAEKRLATVPKQRTDELDHMAAPVEELHKKTQTISLENCLAIEFGDVCAVFTNFDNKLNAYHERMRHQQYKTESAADAAVTCAKPPVKVKGGRRKQTRAAKVKALEAQQAREAKQRRQAAEAEALKAQQARDAEQRRQAAEAEALKAQQARDAEQRRQAAEAEALKAQQARDAEQRRQAAEAEALKAQQAREAKQRKQAAEAKVFKAQQAREAVHTIKSKLCELLSSLTSRLPHIEADRKLFVDVGQAHSSLSTKLSDLKHSIDGKLMDIRSFLGREHSVSAAVSYGNRVIEECQQVIAEIDKYYSPATEQYLEFFRWQLQSRSMGYCGSPAVCGQRLFMVPLVPMAAGAPVPMGPIAGSVDAVDVVTEKHRRCLHSLEMQLKAASVELLTTYSQTAFASMRDRILCVYREVRAILSTHAVEHGGEAGDIEEIIERSTSLLKHFNRLATLEKTTPVRGAASASQPAGSAEGLRRSPERPVSVSVEAYGDPSVRLARQSSPSSPGRSLREIWADTPESSPESPTAGGGFAAWGGGNDIWSPAETSSHASAPLGLSAARDQGYGSPRGGRSYGVPGDGVRVSDSSSQSDGGFDSPLTERAATNRF